MKKSNAKIWIILSLIFALCITAILPTAKTHKAHAQESNTSLLNLIVSSVTTETITLCRESFEVYGNTNLTEKEFREIVNEGSNKVYLHYNTDSHTDLSYDALLLVKSNQKIHSFEFIEMGSRTADKMCAEIKNFLLNHAYVINEVQTVNNTGELLQTRTTVPTTFINCAVEMNRTVRFDDKGYIILHIAVSKYVANSESIVYIVTVNNSFVPGIVGVNNDEDGFKKYKNKSGYVHMKVAQAYDATDEYMFGIREGNVPYYKDHWPVNLPATISIMSSLQAGVNLGYSFQNGFSLSGASIQENMNLGANISFGYSKTITTTEPELSVQSNSVDNSICEWNYTFDTLADVTYHQQTNYMFEISNSRNGMFIGDFRLILDYKQVVDRWWLWASAESFYTADLIVRAGEYNAIYDFNNGMI